jgi:biotin transport system substrate-specific component
MMVLSSLFAGLTAVGALIVLPFPVVPMTLQTFFVLLSGILLGAKGGALAQALYVLMGLLGLPVFAGGTGGIQTIFSPSFGFLLGFIAAAWVEGRVVELDRWNDSPWRYVLACASALVIIYGFGVTGVFLNLNYVAGKSVSVLTTLKIALFPFIVPDLLKSGVVLLIALRVGKRVRALSPLSERI